MAEARAAYDLAIFDFDGTLADSFPFFVSVHNEVARLHGFRSIDAEEIPALRHLPALDIMRRLGLPRWKLPLVARTFTKLMRERGAGVKPFAGIAEALCDLKLHDVALAIVTSNSEDNVRRTLGEAVFTSLQHIECGASMFGKKARIERVLRKLGVAQRRALYIGDQLADLQAARDAGVHFGAVAWGYSAVEALQAAQPDVVFASVEDLRSIAAASSA